MEEVKINFPTAYEVKQNGRTLTKSRPYPESMVVLDPTCTLEQILNRAQYGQAIPQRDVSGDITNEELQVLGLDGTSLATMSRMQLIDLRMRAQMRLQAIEARKLKKAQKEREEALKKGALDEYLASQRTQ